VCERVLTQAPEASHAHFVLAALAYDAGRWADAEGRLERVLALEPEHPGAWQMLGAVYARSDRMPQLEALQTRYRRRFGKPLEVPGVRPASGHAPRRQ